jgi:hypothetical protein
MAYRHVVAIICVAPFAFFFARFLLHIPLLWFSFICCSSPTWFPALPLLQGKEHKLGWSVWLWLFVNALSG